MESAPLRYLGKRQRYELLRSQLDTEFNSFLSQYRDLNDFILPSRGRFFITDVNKGDRRNLKIYDNTAYMAARTLSSGMMAGVTSPARGWYKLTTPDPDLAENGAVKQWLHVVTQRMSTLFQRSNLYNVLPNLYGDLGVFGTSAMLMEEDFQRTSRFYSFPTGTYRIAKDMNGRVNVFYREFRMTVRQVVEMFGERDAKTGAAKWDNISKHVKALWDQGNYEVWVDICHVIEPNERWNPNKPDAKFKKFSSCYYERGTTGKTGTGNNGIGTDDSLFLRESGYDYFPVLCPRWQVTGQDVYGTDCPGMVALGDIKQLQHGEKRGAQALDKIVNPPMVAPTSLITSKASIISGDITYVDDREGGFRPAHDMRISLQELELKQDSIRNRIKRAFFEDLFLMLASSDRRDFTATEILERKEEKLLAVGPVLEQLNQDVLDPLIDNQFYLMQRQGLLPPAPEELQGMDLKVEYISVMSQAQKLVGVGGIERLMNFSAGVIKMNPASADKIDFDQMIDEYAEAVGTSPRLVRPDEQVDEIRAEHQKQMQQQALAQNVQAGSAAAKNLSQANLDGNNALTKLMDSMGKAQEQNG